MKRVVNPNKVASVVDNPALIASVALEGAIDEFTQKVPFNIDEPLAYIIPAQL